jgi:hypothetical protein
LSFHIYTLRDEGKIQFPSSHGYSVQNDTLVTPGCTSHVHCFHRQCAALEQLCSSSLTLNTIPPHIFVKQSRHLRQWLQPCCYAICTQWHSALVKSNSPKCHVLLSTFQCSVFSNSSCSFYTSVLHSSKTQRKVKKSAKCVWNGSFSCHVSTLMCSRTTAALVPNSLYALRILVFSSSYIFNHKTHSMWVAPV